MKRFLGIVLVVIIVATIFGGTLDEIKKRGYIIMGTEATYPPFEYVDEQSKQIVGFDVEIARLIAKKLGVNLVIKDIAFDGLIPALITGKIDMIIAAMTITEERAKMVAFSDPYFTAGQVIVVRKADSFRPKSYEDLAGHRVGVQQGTTADIDVSKVKGVDIVRYTRFTDAFLDLSIGRIDAVVLDFAPAQAYVKFNSKLVISSPVLSEEKYGIAVRKEDKDLLEVINEVLKEMKTKTCYDFLVSLWF
jgi:ABC-type amino acid transport substrate-binding protein